MKYLLLLCLAACGGQSLPVDGSSCAPVDAGRVESLDAAQDAADAADAADALAACACTVWVDDPANTPTGPARTIEVCGTLVTTCTDGGDYCTVVCEAK